MSIASDLTPRKLCRVLDLCGLIAAVQPEGVTFSLLPAWGREEMLWAGWHQVFANPRTQKLLQELGAILNNQ